MRFYPTCFYLILLAIFVQLCKGETGDVLSTETSTSGRMVEKVEWNDTEKGFILISYPKGFTNAKLYHLNFWFPGTSGNPGAGIADKNDGYVEVCLSYLAKKNFALGEFAREHWTMCRSVEARLLARKGFAVGQRIVSGVSKGGWLAFELSADPPRGLDGVVIVAAGILPREKRIPNLKQSRLSVLVCTGETDTNYPFAQMAEDYYRECGLKDYTYEEWLTLGHVSHISDRVNEWLNVQAKKKEAKVVLQSYCEYVVTQRLQEWQEVASPKERYISLRHYLKSPATAYIGAGLREKMLTKGRELEGEETVVVWHNEYNILRRIVQVEVKLFQEGPVTSSKLAAIKGHFLKLSQNAKLQDIRIRAAYGYLRNTKAHASLLIQENERAAPEFKKLEKELLELRNQLNRQNPPDRLLLQQFQQMATDLEKRSADIAMDAFRKVEWHGQFTLDNPKIHILLAEGKQASGEAGAYTGVSY